MIVVERSPVVGLAEALECPVLTRDRRLARSPGHGAEVVLR